MDATLRQQTAFHLTGRAPEEPLEPIHDLGLRPALMARYRELSRLRYDFPVVLLEPGPNGEFVRSLSDIVNDLARNAAPAGPPGEALRKHFLRVERAMRRCAADAPASFRAAWEQAVAGLDEVDPRLREVLSRAGETAGVDGMVADCDETLPEKFMVHAWRSVQSVKLTRARAEINRLIVRLNDILRADFVRSEAGRRPETLKASVGTQQHALFDFQAMSRLLSLGAPASRLSATRRERIERALAVLRGQRFFAAEGAPAGQAYEYQFDTCRAVLRVFAERLPELVELVKAMSIAELESDGRYDESRHDPFFAGFDASSVSDQDMALFPDYLVCLRGRPTGAATDANLMELMSSGIAVKVLVETDDLLEESAFGRGGFAFGVRSVQLASLAIGLTDTFVLQSTSSNLLQLADRVRRGLAGTAPALFSVYTPARARAGEVPPYLMSAAAMQSRAFPSFTYDPGAGPDMASRFSLEDNPQPGRDWPVVAFEYADADLQRISDELAFTLADFAAMDPRYARHFARVPHAGWNEHMIPAAEWLSRPPAANDSQVPYVLAVNAANELQRLVVDDRLMQAARRCLENWHRLQEMGGVNNSHAARLLARERAAWESMRPAAPEPGVETRAAVAPSAGLEPPPEEEPPERSPDEAWIETIRCSSCNECTQINDKMFSYNENQQAYIKDPKAGTFRQMVEAAESCQLSIIHPGKPANPQEAGLEELLARAQPFY
jgi:hypothetical protein